MSALRTGSTSPLQTQPPHRPVTVPPAYPDPETWRKFGLYRRQLHSRAHTSSPAQPATTEQP